MDAGLVTQFWVVAVLLAMTPGADWAYAISAGLRGSSVLPSVAGMVAGYVVVVTVVALGVGAVISEHPTALTALTTVGALYLVYLGLSALLSKVEHLTEGAEPVSQPPLTQFARGAGISGINPKGLLLLLALLPQFTAADGWPSALQMLALGGLHVLNCAVVYFAVALGARRILRSRPSASIVVTRIAGIVMILIGTVLLIEKIIHLA